MNKLIGTILIVVILGVFSCVEDYKQAIPIKQLNFIVEGYWSGDPKSTFLKITQIDKVGNPKSIVDFEGLQVKLKSKSGKEIRFSKVPFIAGQYKPDNFLTFASDDSIKLILENNNGERFESLSQILPPKVELEKISYKVVESPRPGYFISSEFTDPLTPGNFYRLESEFFYVRKSTGVPVGFGGARCCQLCWVKENSDNLNIIDDKLTNGNLLQNISIGIIPYYTLPMAQAKVRLISISAATANYYKLLSAQKNRTGSIFDVLPANVPGNIFSFSNAKKPLGYFELMSYTEKTIVISDENPSIIKYKAQYETEFYIPEGDCMLRFPYSLYFLNANQKLF
jgi:hypothetical protein